MRRLYMSYIGGFVASLAVTMAAYVFTNAYGTVERLNRDQPEIAAVAALLGMATLQLIIQVVFFLHLGSESKPRYNTIAFFSMLLVIGIVGIGSLWIMYNLDYNMSSSQVERFIQREENIHTTTHR